MVRTLRSLSVIGLCGCLSLAAIPAHGGIIPFNQFLEFSFFDAGQSAAGCFPADPGGDFCIPGAQLLAAPPWTFIAPAGGATLVVVDGFIAGDRFQLFDSGVSIGLTSAPGTGDCGSDPVSCLANANMSQGSFTLAAGSHSITLVAILSPSGGGAGFLQVKAEQVPELPEPGLSALLTVGLIALYGWRRRSRKG